MKSIKRVLYPEKDVYGEGENVAIAYWEDLETPIYTLRAYDRMYIAYIYIRVLESRIYVFYSNTNIKRLKRIINKKVKQGYMTEEQGTKCVLTLACNMVEGKLGLL